MFAFLQKEKEERLIKSPVVVEPPEEADFIESYARVATKLGVVSYTPAANATTLATFLNKEFIQVYDRAMVERYMDKKGYWGWFQLTAKTRIMNIARVTPTDYHALFGTSSNGLYTEPVPLPVLLAAERIADNFHDAQFFVAAQQKHPDPFLGVCLLSEPRGFYIIERWDEPSFRG